MVSRGRKKIPPEELKRTAIAKRVYKLVEERRAIQAIQRYNYGAVNRLHKTLHGMEESLLKMKELLSKVTEEYNCTNSKYNRAHTVWRKLLEEYGWWDKNDHRAWTDEPPED